MLRRFFTSRRPRGGFRGIPAWSHFCNTLQHLGTSDVLQERLNKTPIGRATRRRSPLNFNTLQCSIQVLARITFEFAIPYCILALPTRYFAIPYSILGPLTFQFAKPYSILTPTTPQIAPLRLYNAVRYCKIRA